MAQITFRYRTEPIEIDGETRNYFSFCSCGCYGENCLEYSGEVPDGFPFDVDIRCYYLLEVDGLQSIVYDPIREVELQEQCKVEEENYRHLIGLDKNELEGKITDQEIVNEDQDDLLANHGSRITALEMGGEFNFAVGNNLLYGTSMTSQSPWFTHSNSCLWVERQTPPEYSDEWWFGGYWYCTKDYLTYKKGNMYHYNNGVWELTELTRYELAENYSISGINLLNSEFTNTNFISGKAALFEDTFDEYSVGLSQVVYPIYNNYDDLTLSFKIQNNMLQGNFIAQVIFYNEYDKARYLRSGVENWRIPIYHQDYEITPDELNNLTEVKIKVPMQKQSNVLLNGYKGDTAPSDKTLYWINTSDFYQLYEFKEGEWVKSNETRTIKIDDTYYMYDVQAWSINENEHVYLGNYYCSRTDITNYETKSIEIRLATIESYVNYISETEPTPERNVYWANPTTNEVFRSKYNGDTFVGWELIESTYAETVDFGYAGIPRVSAKGNVIIGDVKLEYGNYTIWSPNPNEIEGGNVDITNDHIILYKDSGNKVMFTGEEISVYNDKEKIFDIDGDTTYTKIHNAIESDIDGLVTKKINVNDKNIYIRYIR